MAVSLGIGTKAGPLAADVATGVVVAVASPARTDHMIEYPTFSGPALPAEPVAYTRIEAVIDGA